MESKNRKLKLGKHLSAWLSRRSERLSSGVKKGLLLVVFVAVGAYCFSLILGNSRTIFLSQRISLPGISALNEKAAIQQRIGSLNSYLDSLRASPDGLMVYDSLLIAHPHIYDSIAKWEQQVAELP